MSSLAYSNYWKRKTLLARSVPKFSVLPWWPDESLCTSEKWIFDHIRNAKKLLDFGAGDLKCKVKFRNAGFEGVYHTMDIETEFEYDFSSLEEVPDDYDAILCLDVIEHLNLEDGLNLIEELIDRLNPGGVLILQTPNARCIRNPYGWDMTHLHCYNVTDLWTWLTCRGLSTEGRRVRFVSPKGGLKNKIRGIVSAFCITRILGADYADNILLAARKPVAE